MSKKYGKRKNSAPSQSVCIKNEQTGIITRVKREKALELVKENWTYTSKSVWKAFKNSLS